MTAFEAGEETCYIASDASEVYPQARSVVREALAVGRASWFAIRDVVTSEEPPLVEWLLHTTGEIAVGEDFLVCACEKADLFVWFVAPGPDRDRLDPTPVRRRIERGNLDAKEGVGHYVRLSNVPVEATAEFLTLLFPVKKGGAHPGVKVDGNVVRVAWEGKRYRVGREGGRLSVVSE